MEVTSDHFCTGLEPCREGWATDRDFEDVGYRW